MKIQPRYVWFASIILLLAGLQAIPTIAQDALPPNSIHLKSQTLTVTTGTIFTVDVLANATTPAYGFGFQLEFDPTYLQIIERPDTDTVTVAAPVGSLFPTAQRIKNSIETVGDTRQIDAIYTLLPPALAAQGTGTLATVSFQVLAAGSTQLNLLHPRLIELSGEVAQDIPLTVVNPTLLLEVTASSGTISPVRLLDPVGLPPIGVLGLLLMMVAVVLLLILVIWRTRQRQTV